MSKRDDQRPLEDGTMAQVTVEDGTGYVAGYDGGGEPPKTWNGERNARVIINADHLEHGVKGWADTHDPAVWERGVLPAIAHAAHVRYRVVTKRRGKGVPADTPVADLSPKQKVRELELLEVLSEQAQGSPGERYVRETMAQANGHAVQDTPQAAVAVQERPPAPAPPPDPSPPAPGPEEAASPPSPPQAVPRGPRREEARPWERDNTDGTPNLGSYAIGAAVGMVDLAWEVCHAAERPQAVRQVAAALLDAADTAQALVRPDGRFDRMDTSHVRARGAVRTVLPAHPLPFGKGTAALRQWVEEVAEEAAALILLAVSLDK